MNGFHPICHALAASLAVGAVHAQESAPAQAASPPVELPVNAESVKPDSSYALGYRMGNIFSQEFGRFGVVMDDLDHANFLKGFSAAARGQQPEIDELKLQASMQALGNLLQEREKQTAAANLKAGTDFLAENAKRDGVTTTTSGLQYEIIEQGGDEKYVVPKEGEPDDKQFLVNYRGTLIDGTEFDASAPGEPVPMTLEVVDGFKEALTMMPVGAKWKIYLPADLAYGEQRRSPQIGPNSALVFDIELVKIQTAPAPEGLPFPMPQRDAGQ